MIIRAATPIDFPAIDRLVARAFSQPDEARLVDALRRGGDAVFDLVATSEASVIGHVMLSRMNAPFPALGLAPVAVVEERRNRGVATALVLRGLEDAERAGWRATFVLGDPAFYSRFGFDAESARGFSSPYAGPHFMVKALGGDLPTTIGAVDYPPSFAALD